MVSSPSGRRGSSLLGRAHHQGGWGRLSDDRPGQHNPDSSEDPWGGGLPTLHGGASARNRPDTERDIRGYDGMHEGRKQTNTWSYLDEPSAYAVARRTGVSQQTVTRCLERAAELGVLAALDDRARTGREAVITPEARAWLVSLACAKPIAFGYPHELWTTRLLAAPARDHGPQAGHQALAKLAQGTVCKILAAHEVKPHKVRYYLEQRDPEFEPKMAEVLCVYRDSKPPDPNAAQIRSSGWRLRTGEAEPRERLQRSCPPLTVRSITPVARWRPRRSLSRGPAEAARPPTAAIVMEI